MSLRGGWQSSNSKAPKHLQVLKHVATIKSIGSSTRIEGSQLENKQIEELLGNVGKVSPLTRDEQDVAGYAEAMEMVFENYVDIPLTENYIKQLHTTLLRHSEKDVRHRGEYKKLTSNVEAFAPDGKNLGVVFETNSPFDTPKEMRDLLIWTRETLEDKSYHTLIVIAIFNVVFLAIHPFQDGNGRLSRVLISLLMLKAGYSYIPYSSLESIVEQNKEAYYKSLQRTQKTLKNEKADWLPWLHFFLNSLKQQKDHLFEKAKTLEKSSALTYESMVIMQYAGEYQRITIKDAKGLIDTVSRPTIKNRLSQLVEQGLLIRHGKARGTWYSKPD